MSGVVVLKLAPLRVFIPCVLTAVGSGACGACGVWGMRRVGCGVCGVWACGVCGVWGVRGVGHAGCGACGVWGVWGVGRTGFQDYQHERQKEETPDGKPRSDSLGWQSILEVREPRC